MARATRWPLLSGLICLPLLMSVCSSFADGPICDKDDRLCGPKCLLSLCQGLGIEADLDKLTTLCHYDEKNGTSLAGLLDAARAKGLEAVGMKIGVGELADLRCPAIAHLWDNHFAVVEAESSGKLKVSDPPSKPQIMTTEQFQPHYSGFALLVAKDKSPFPIPKDGGADLRLNSYSWDFGIVQEGAKLEHVVTCRNAGNGELVISGVDASCDCTKAQATQQRIPPGGKGEIRVSFDGTGLSGAQRKIVYFHSNDPVTPVVQLQVTGLVRPTKLLYSPKAVSFGTVRKGENASREVLVPKSELQDVDVQRVSCDLPFVRTATAQKPDRSGWIVSVSLAPDAPIAKITGKMAVYTSHRKDPKIEVPITATIRGDIDVFPETLFLGIVKKGKDAENTVTVTTVGAKPLKIGKIDNPLKHVSVTVKLKVEGKEYLLTAKLSPEAPPGYINGEVITIHTNDPDQPEITVPVHALVED